jgi:hypothetical protein
VRTRAAFCAIALPLLATGLAPQEKKAAPAKSSPAIVQFIFHDRREAGPPIPTDYAYIPGELMYISFRVRGYKVQKDRVDLRWQLIGTDPEGLLLWPTLNGAFSDEVSYADENWLPRVDQTIALPPQLPPGVFKLKVRVADEFTSATAEETFEFRVRGRVPPPSDSFEIRDTVFTRDEQGRQVTDPPVYRPGDSVFARFTLVGYQLGEKNRFDVEYGLRILRPSGRELYAEPKAAQESDAPFYPKRFMTGTLAVNLTPDLTPGEYTMIVVARDNVGGKQAEETFKFKVEK